MHSQHTYTISSIRKPRLFGFFITILIFQLVVGICYTTPVEAQKIDPHRELIRQILIKNHYSGIAEHQLQGKSITEMISTINDPYTRYVLPSIFTVYYDQDLQGFVGMGFEFHKNDEQFLIKNIFPQSTASESGIKQNDEIIEVNGKVVTSSFTLYEVYQLFDFSVEAINYLKLKREQNIISVELKSMPVKMTQLTSRSIQPGIGYIRISDFSYPVIDEFEKHIDQLQSQGLESLILDLRDNPGGFLQVAGYLFSRFVDEDIMTYSQKKDKRKEALKSKKSYPTLDIPLVILVNENSASASEMLSGALQDYQLAQIVGQPTYGKGVIQQIVSFSEGESLHVTIEEYFTPLQSTVHQVGIKPDIVVTGSLAQTLTAMRLAGVSQMKLEFTPELIRINGLEQASQEQFVYRNQRGYIRHDVLSAFLGKPIKWYPTPQQIEWQDNQQSFYLTLEDEQGFVEHGNLYIDASVLTHHFPEISLNETEGQVFLQRTERK